MFEEGLVAGIQGSVGLGRRQVAYARQGARISLLKASLTAPACRFVFADADADFAGRLVDRAAQTLSTTVSIVRKPADQKCFAVLPADGPWNGRLTRLTAHRRFARDYERDPAAS